MILDDLCSPAYRSQLNQMYDKGAWSGGGARYAEEVSRMCMKARARSVLDYGCGNVDMMALLPRSLQLEEVQSYDPGVPGRDRLPHPADVVLCVDCLEHVEPDKVQNVIRHIYELTRKCAILYISTRPAEKRLPDGRNAHLTIDTSGWWQHQLLDGREWKARIVSDDLYGLHLWMRRLNLDNKEAFTA